MLTGLHVLGQGYAQVVSSFAAGPAAGQQPMKRSSPERRVRVSLETTRTTEVGFDI